MRLQLVLLAASIVGGLSTGWFIAPAPEHEQRSAASPLPVVYHGGAEAASARTRLLALGFGAVDMAIPDEPPPLDVAVLFRRDLTAIEQRADGRVVWIVDLTQGFGRRSLRVGDVYQDGWRVARIDAQTITLRRRRETRTVAAYAPPPEL